MLRNHILKGSLPYYQYNADSGKEPFQASVFYRKPSKTATSDSLGAPACKTLGSWQSHFQRLQYPLIK